MLKLAHWYRKVEESGFKNFINIVLNTIPVNYTSILNYFDNRSKMLQQNLLMRK
jgi:transposase